MAKLVNTFSWSYSAAGDFESCRRKRYWGKYAMWGGWEQGASTLQRTAYRLTKMDSRYTIQGKAVEDSIMWALREFQTGRRVTMEQAYEKVARPYLNRCWKESRGGGWRERPKQVCCLHEHYYTRNNEGTDQSWTQEVVERTKLCITNFIERVLPRLEQVGAEHEVPIGASGLSGAPESFSFEGVTIYAIPDYVYRIDGHWHIHDWKSGRPRESHRDQVALYGLWAHTKHGVAPEDITVYIEYLADGTMAFESFSEERLESTKSMIRESVADMSDYLVDADIQRNEPVPAEEWELAANPRLCRTCNFYELCEPELSES